MKTLLSLAALLAAFLLSDRLRADDAPASAPLNSSYEATREFWDAIHQPFMTQATIDSVKGLQIGDQDEDHARTVRQGFRALAKSAIEKNKRITSLAVLKVDQEAVAFAAKVAALRIELASLCERIAGKIESDARMPDEVAFTVLSSVVAHANDKDGILWNVISDAGPKSADTVSKARAEWIALAALVNTYRDRGNMLQIEEMTVRASLGARYRREFPPAASYPSIVSETGNSKTAK